MTEQPTALRLADLLEKAPAHTLEDGTITLYLGGTVVADKAAAELRRLHAENERVFKLADDQDSVIRRQRTERQTLEAQRDALLEALKELTGHTNKRFTGGVWDRARAAIKAVEGEKT